MKIKLILDRTEGGIAVFTDDAGEVFECSAALLKPGFSEDDMFIAEISEGKIVSLEKTENPYAGDNKKRLESMFKNK